MRRLKIAGIIITIIGMATGIIGAFLPDNLWETLIIIAFGIIFFAEIVGLFIPWLMERRKNEKEN